jgi:hypothetical protein
MHVPLLIHRCKLRASSRGQQLAWRHACKIKVALPHVCTVSDAYEITGVSCTRATVYQYTVILVHRCTRHSAWHSRPLAAQLAASPQKHAGIKTKSLPPVNTPAEFSLPGQPTRPGSHYLHTLLHNGLIAWLATLASPPCPRPDVAPRRSCAAVLHPPATPTPLTPTARRQHWLPAHKAEASPCLAPSNSSSHSQNISCQLRPQQPLKSLDAVILPSLC